MDGLPGDWVAECHKRPVACEQRDVLKGTLGGKHAVKRVAMIYGVTAGADCMQVDYRQMFEAIEFNEFVETAYCLPGDREFSEAVLRGNFPRTRYADENRVPFIINQALGIRGELWVVRPPPEQGMGVQ